MSSTARTEDLNLLLVTGGAGFVMSNVALNWLESSSGNVVILDLARAWDELAQTTFQPYIDAGKLSFVEGSVTDPAAWAAVSALPVTHIVHGAAVTPTEAEEQLNPSLVLSVNIQGSTLALDFAVSLHNKGALKRFMYVSSDAVFNKPGLVREAIPADGPAPWVQNLYAIR